MKRSIMVLAAAIMAFTASNVWGQLHPNVVQANWPATCTFTGPSCGNNHLNNLDGRLRQHGLLFLSMRARQKNDEQTIANLTQAMTNMQNQLNCYSTIAVAQYPASNQGQRTSGTNPPGLDSGEGGTWLDRMRTDNPANNPAWSVVYDYCNRP
jgi:hypothetical protein